VELVDRIDPPPFTLLMAGGIPDRCNGDSVEVFLQVNNLHLDSLCKQQC